MDTDAPNSTIVGYHITTGQNLPRILIEGLKPAIGPRSKLMDEYQPAVHFFDSLPAAKKGLKNWINDIFDESNALYVIECNLGNVENLQQRNESEIASLIDIGINRIRKIMTSDLKTFKVVQPPAILIRQAIKEAPFLKAPRSHQPDLFG